MLCGICVLSLSVSSLFGRVVLADDDARFHRRPREAMALDRLLDDDVGFGEGGVDVAALDVEAERDVVAPFL